MSGELTRVRVLPERALSLLHGEGVEAASMLHLSGDELELVADEAAQLEADGFVERVGRSPSARERRGARADVDLD